MRTIKFRGKNLVNKKWEQGSLVVCNNGRHFITELFDVDEDSWLYWEVDPATVGQFTGLTDKDGKEIYEGDILRYQAKDKTEEKNFVSYEVFWHDNDCADRHIGWQMNRYHYNGNICGVINEFTTCIPKYSSKMIIIGNIYDNPELLKDIFVTPRK